MNATSTASPTSAALVVDGVLLAVALVWGGSYLVAKDLTAVAPVLVALALRYAVSTAALALVCSRRGARIHERRELTVGVVPGCTQASVLALETYGVAKTSATNAGLSSA